MSAGLENNDIGPVYIDHGRLVDTVVEVTPFDPRLGGFDVAVNGGPRPYVPPRAAPTFQGEVVAWYEKVGTKRYAYLLIGHDANDGQGLRWIEVRGVQPNRIQLTDQRTNQPFDPYYETNCDPPWICE